MVDSETHLSYDWLNYQLTDRHHDDDNTFGTREPMNTISLFSQPFGDSCPSTYQRSDNCDLSSLDSNLASSLSPATCCVVSPPDPPSLLITTPCWAAPPSPRRPVRNSYSPNHERRRNGDKTPSRSPNQKKGSTDDHISSRATDNNGLRSSRSISYTSPQSNHSQIPQPINSTVFPNASFLSSFLSANVSSAAPSATERKSRKRRHPRSKHRSSSTWSSVNVHSPDQKSNSEDLLRLSKPPPHVVERTSPSYRNENVVRNRKSKQESSLNVSDTLYNEHLTFRDSVGPSNSHHQQSFGITHPLHYTSMPETHGSADQPSETLLAAEMQKRMALEDEMNRLRAITDQRLREEKRRTEELKDRLYRTERQIHQQRDDNNNQQFGWDALTGFLWDRTNNVNSVVPPNGNRADSVRVDHPRRDSRNHDIRNDTTNRGDVVMDLKQQLDVQRVLLDDRERKIRELENTIASQSSRTNRMERRMESLTTSLEEAHIAFDRIMDQKNAELRKTDEIRARENSILLDRLQRSNEEREQQEVGL